MEFRNSLAVALSIAAGLVGIEAIGQVPVPEARAYEVGVSVRPTKQNWTQLMARPTPNTFSCTASVKEPGVFRSRSAIDLAVAPGSSEEKSLDAGDFSFRFSVTIPVGAEYAQTEVVVFEGKRVVSRYRAEVSFPGPSGGATVRPAE